MRYTIGFIALLIFILVTFSIAGTMDYEAAKLEEQHCFKMVEYGAWPVEVCD